MVSTTRETEESVGKEVNEVPKSYYTPPESDLEGGDNGIIVKANPLSRNLEGRHMQMIAIGGAIGAGLFVGSGGALASGGPGSLVVGYLIVGSMLLCTMQALGELAVLYPVNGVFYTYVVRFVDPSLGFAVGWEYTIGWMVVLPFELNAAAITIQFWRTDINVGVWITVFLTVIAIIQIFGVRGYGEVEFILSVIKILGIVGFFILGIIIDCGGVGDQGYIGASYWHDPGAFTNGFKGFCSVFVVASFAFGGTELVALAAAEATNPRKAIPQACKQVFWRISLFYVLSLFIVGLVVRSDNPNLLYASGAQTKYSPFVIAIKLAGIKALPSIFNVIITVSVVSVANSSTFGATRTLQALAERGMAPRQFAYVDLKGRPVWGTVLQLSFGLLAFIGEAANQETIFAWLMSLSGLSSFFIWGSTCLAHIRFRAAWKAQGHSKDELPYQALFGIVGSWYGLVLNILCIIATFYISVWPPGERPSPRVLAEGFFQQFLAIPIITVLFVFWKVFSRHWALYIPVEDMDIDSGRRSIVLGDDYQPELKTWRNFPTRAVRALF